VNDVLPAATAYACTSWIDHICDIADEEESIAGLLDSSCFNIFCIGGGHEHTEEIKDYYCVCASSAELVAGMRFTSYFWCCSK